MTDILSPFSSTASVEENTHSTTPPAEDADTAENATDSGEEESSLWTRREIAVTGPYIPGSHR